PPPEPPRAAPPAPKPVASAAPPPPEPVAPPPTSGPPVATVQFAVQSAEITDVAKAELDRVAKTLTGARQVEVHGYAGGGDPAESRKVSLARALVVRSYLIDQGVKGRIEIGAYTSTASGGVSERVDVMAPSN
ncbi:MAG: OmpA family protein, partial [Reyranellales bacterium]